MLGAKNHRKNLHKHPGPTFQIRSGAGHFSSKDELDHLVEDHIFRESH